MPLYLKDKMVSGVSLGVPGKSAYEAAKEGGYTGTEEEFNQALTSVPGHITNTENPHSVTAAQVGADVAGAANEALNSAKAYTDQIVAGVIPGENSKESPTDSDSLFIYDNADSGKPKKTLISKLVELFKNTFYTKDETSTLLANKAGWSQNNITGSVLDWAKSQTIPTSGYTNMDATDVPYSGYWLVNVLMTNVNSNWKVVLVYSITSPVEVWYRVYNYGNWNTEWRKLLNDSLTPSEIGAYTKTETNELLDSKPDKNNGKYLTALNLAHSDSPDVVRGKIFCSYDGSGNGIIGIDTLNSNDGSAARLMLRANGAFQKLMGDSNGNFGTPDNLAYESQLKYKRMYQCTGLILDGDGCDMQGVGTASVILHYNGVAEINFSVKITQNSNSGVFKWGINPSLLSARNANIPAITPIQHLGICNLFTDSGAYNLSALEYGGIIEVDTGRWRIARVYTADGAIGGYPCDIVSVGQVITGTCYGYF